MTFIRIFESTHPETRETYAIHTRWIRIHTIVPKCKMQRLPHLYVNKFWLLFIVRMYLVNFTVLTLRHLFFVLCASTLYTKVICTYIYLRSFDFGSASVLTFLEFFIFKMSKRFEWSELFTCVAVKKANHNFLKEHLSANLKVCSFFSP